MKRFNISLETETPAELVAPVADTVIEPTPTEPAEETTLVTDTELEDTCQAFEDIADAIEEGAQANTELGQYDTLLTEQSADAVQYAVESMRKRLNIKSNCFSMEGHFTKVVAVEGLIADTGKKVWEVIKVLFAKLKEFFQRVVKYIKNKISLVDSKVEKVIDKITGRKFDSILNVEQTDELRTKIEHFNANNSDYIIDSDPEYVLRQLKGSSIYEIFDDLIEEAIDLTDSVVIKNYDDIIEILQSSDTVESRANIEKLLTDRRAKNFHDVEKKSHKPEYRFINDKLTFNITNSYCSLTAKNYTHTYDKLVKVIKTFSIDKASETLKDNNKEYRELALKFEVFNKNFTILENELNKRILKLETDKQSQSSFNSYVEQYIRLDILYLSRRTSVFTKCLNQLAELLITQTGTISLLADMVEFDEVIKK